MTTETPTPRGPGRPRSRSATDDRIEAIRARRQARGPATYENRYKLHVPEDQKDPRWTYRWVTDSEMRVRQLQAQDWEFAPQDTTGGSDQDAGMGTRIERVVSDRTVTSPEKGFLMRKPLEFFEEDRKARMDRLKAQEQQVSQGVVNDPQALAGPHAYVPSGGMSIKVGSSS